MNRVNDLRSQSLDLLRFPLAVVVLSIHTFSSQGIAFQDNVTTFDNYVAFAEVNKFIDAFLRGQSVPIYYFISGFVFFLGVEMTKETYIRKFKNRLKSLVIPYFIWNTLAILLLIITLTSSFAQYKATKVVFTPSLESVLSCFWVYTGGLEGAETWNFALQPLNAPLWFIRDLIIVVLCTPLLHFLLKRLKFYFVVLLGIIWFVLPYCHINLLSFETAFFFFSWGAYMSINRKDMLVVFGRYFKLSIFLYVLLGFLHVIAAHYYPEAMNPIKQLNVLVGLFFAYNFASWLLKRGICKVNPFLASASFFIYVSHFLIVGKILKLLYIGFHPSSSLTLLIVYTSTVILTVGLLLGIFYVMERYTPRLLKVIAGRK